MSSLKPCPFCGGPARIEHISPYMTNGRYFVRCRECGARATAYEWGGPIREFTANSEALDAWNARADVKKDD